MDWDEACRQASAMVATRNYAEAEQVIYGAYNQVKAENNLEKICTSLDLLGWLCFMQSKHQQASEIYYYCAQAKVQLMGADNIEVAKTIKNIIASTYQLKQYEKVVDMARECLRIFALHLPRENPEIATLGKNLYELLKWMNRIPEAEHVKHLYLDPPAPAVPQMQAQAQSGAYAIPQQQQMQQHQVQPQTQSGAYNVPQQQQPPQAQPHQQQQAYQQQQHQYQQQAQQQPQQQPQPQAQSSTASGNQWAQQAYANQSQSQAQPAMQPPPQQQPQQAPAAQNQWAPQPQTQSGAYAVPQQQQQQQPQPQQQPASQGHFRQISIPPQNAAPAQQAPLSTSQAPVQQIQQVQQTSQAQPEQGAPPTDSAAKAAAARRKDYSKFAKSICDVCKQEYEGAGCLRCTSAGIKAFDPGSTFGSEW
ncbi:MAG: hypothetical protein SFY67_15440 [Candidatus Melainabacteria bacterium]|nr:hypothetical protein [Candidatus Melainabacteria bacterium]